MSSLVRVSLLTASTVSGNDVTEALFARRFSNNFTGALEATVGCKNRADILTCANDWVDKKIGYCNPGSPTGQCGCSSCYANTGEGKRCDCSGFVSSCWGLGNQPSTAYLDQYCTTISESQLLPGDALLKSSATHGGHGHVFFFESWNGNNINAIEEPGCGSVRWASRAVYTPSRRAEFHACRLNTLCPSPTPTRRRTPSPTRRRAPAPTYCPQGYCKANSPSNGCGCCRGINSDCGSSTMTVAYCMAQHDSNCPSSANATIV